MTTAYRVTAAGFGSPADMKLFLEIRSDLFGYSAAPADLHLHIEGNIHLKASEVGLVASEAEAHLFRDRLSDSLPSFDWVVERCDFEQADGITIYKQTQ